MELIFFYGRHCRWLLDGRMPRMFTEGSPGGIQNSYPKKLEQGLGVTHMTYLILISA